MKDKLNELDKLTEKLWELFAVTQGWDLYNADDNSKLQRSSAMNFVDFINELKQLNQKNFHTLI